MKIVFLSNASIPSLTANSLQIMKTCAALARAGHDVTVIVPRFWRERPTAESLSELYGVRIAFRIEWLRGYRTLGRLWYEWRAHAHAMRARADLYYTINERMAARLAAGGHPVVLEMHESPTLELSIRALRELGTASGVLVVVMVTRALLRILTARFPALENQRLLTEHNGVDLERYTDIPDAPSARRALGWKEDALTAGYAGHLYKGRGIEIILGLAAEFPLVAFKVIGGEPASVTKLSEEITRLGLQNVELLGFISNDKLTPLLYGCDVLLMPYGKRVRVSGGAETAAYASPMKMFDYMPSGRLIISSRLPGIAEVLNDDNALLCEPDDLADWIRGMRLAHDADLRSRLSERARADADHYTWDARTARILEAVSAGAADAPMHQPST